MEDDFCEDHRRKILERNKHIEEEWQRGETPIIYESLDRAFTWKEFRIAMKSLSKKLTKAPGKDGIWNWMLFTSSDQFQKELLNLFNMCWEEESMPESWLHTLVSYIYKGKGNKNELTSYRPIGLSSALVNLFKKMWLNRIAPILMEQMAPNQGGFRKGSGAREQLWTLAEFLEERMDEENGSVFCTTDAHKAFDQVFREGTTYLLYGHGIRGRMLKMISTWIHNNISTQLWRGHIGNEIRLDDNGIRQGCNLSPLLYLIIINTLVSKEPTHSMPEWDEQFRKEAYSQGVQLIATTMEGEWKVYLFVDDTAFLAEKTSDMNRILAAYNNFVNKWRIRINAGKCKALENSHMHESSTAYMLGGSIVSKVLKLKYLGVWLNEKGTSAHDVAKKAEATQSRFKLKTTRERLGEGLALEQLRSHITPSILYGLELGKVKNDTLDGWHAWCLSEVMGIGRKAADCGHTGGEVNRTCVWADYQQQTWSQTRAQNAKGLHRSIYRMEATALPKECLQAKGMVNILTKTYSPKVLGSKRKGNYKARITETLGGTLTPWGNREWKLKEKGHRAEDAKHRRKKLQTDLRETVTQRQTVELERYYLGLGSGTAYIQSLQPTDRSSTGTLQAKGQCDRKKIRALKAGQMAHLKTNAYVKDGAWKHLSHNQRKSAIECGCGAGGVQDMEHVMTRCLFTRGYVDRALTAVEAVREKGALTTIQARIGAAFGTTDGEGSKTDKVTKILSRLHDNVQVCLKAQLIVNDSTAALPIIPSQAA